MNGSAATEPTFWAAVDVAKANIPVFPVKGKEPTVEGGFYACTTDLSQIAEWIEDGRGDHDVAIPTGLPSGVVVIDADTPEAYAKMEERYGRPTVLTRRGGHWWFSHPRNGKVWSNSVEDGLDRKGDGGLVVVPPSRGRSWTDGIPNRAALPTLPREFWSKKAERSEAPRKAPQDLKEAAAEAIAARVARIPQGSRHEHLRHLCGVLLARGVADGDAEDVLIAAWKKVGGDLAERADREVPNTIATTEQALAEDRATGVPSLEEITPGLYAELEGIFGWRAEIKIGGKNRGSVGGGESDAPEEKEEKEEKATQAQLLVRCAAGAELFHTPDGEAFASVPVGGHRETHKIKSKGFRRWLVRGFFDSHDRPPGAQALQDALGVLEARAQFDGSEREVYVRIAGNPSGNTIYVDLANDRWEVVEITATGWRVVPGDRVSVRFRRSRGMLPLPTPAKLRDDRDGLDDLLRTFTNLADKNATRLVVAWLIQALRPTGPYPVLLFQGEQGSAKSTAERMVRALVDPSTAPLRTTPRNERDLVIAATNAWCVAFDNISNLPPWLSDAMCRLSTGGGFSARELYTDAEEVLFDATRPLLLNGISDVATRPDLLDRALPVTLPPIPEEKRRPEAELWREFEKARPRILAGLLDAVSGAISAVESVRLEGMPRMADFAVWATAAESALGWEPGAFMAAYAGNRAEAAETALEADPVATAVRTLMTDTNEWTGTSGELWEKLSEIVGDSIRHTKAWPGAPNALSGRMKRLAPVLRGIGIEYEDARAAGGERKRAKRLKNMRVKDRPHRSDRPAKQENPAKQDNQAGTMMQKAGRSGEDRGAKTVPDEFPANGNIRDDRDGRDDDLQLHSKSYSEDIRKLFKNPPGWLRNQARTCREQGAPERLLKPLAVAVATHLYEDHARTEEILPAVEAQFHPIDCDCEECL